MFRGNEPQPAEEWIQDAKELSNEHPTSAQTAALIGIGILLVQIRDLIRWQAERILNESR